MPRGSSVLLVGLALAAAAGCTSSGDIPDRSGDRSREHVLRVFARDHDSWKTLRARIAGRSAGSLFVGELVVDRPGRQARVDAKETVTGTARVLLDAYLRTLLPAGTIERAYDPNANCVYEKRNGTLFSASFLGSESLALHGQAILSPEGRKEINLSHGGLLVDDDNRIFATAIMIRRVGDADEAGLALRIADPVFE